ERADQRLGAPRRAGPARRLRPAGAAPGEERGFGPQRGASPISSYVRDKRDPPPAASRCRGRAPQTLAVSAVFDRGCESRLHSPEDVYADPTHPPPGPLAAMAKRRRRLLWKYVVFFSLLVTGALLANGAIETYFSYQEN